RRRWSSASRASTASRWRPSAATRTNTGVATPSWARSRSSPDVEACRPASADDIPRVAELARLMRAELVAMRGGALWLGREAWPEPLDDTYGALLPRDEAAVLVGTIDDVVVGFGVVVVETLRSGARLGVLTDLF